jgi:hypothetical protein
VIWGDIQTGFSTLLNRRDATSAQQAAWLQNGIQKIQRELRCPAMEKLITFTVGSDYSGGIVIPNDFLELQYMLNSQGSRITKEDITTVQHLSQGVGPPGVTPVLTYDFPRFYIRKGPQWLLGPTPVLGDTINIAYYANLPPMVNPDDSSALAQIAGDLFMYAGLVYAGDFFSDKRADKWEARYEQIKADLQGMADADEISGGSEVSAAVKYPDEYDIYV